MRGDFSWNIIMKYICFVLGEIIVLLKWITLKHYFSRERWRYIEIPSRWRVFRKYLQQRVLIFMMFYES